MEEFKDFIINRCTDFHVKIYYGTSYENNEQGVYDKLKDIVRYEELKEVVRNHPKFDNEEIGREISARVRKRTSIW